MPIARASLPVFKQAWSDWSEDNASHLAAALAYYTALSLAPMVVLAVVLLNLLHIDGQHTASAYGAAGSLAAVLIWVYYSAQIMFFGAEFTQAHDAAP